MIGDFNKDFKNDKLIGSITGYSYTDLDSSDSTDIFLSQRLF